MERRHTISTTSRDESFLQASTSTSSEKKRRNRKAYACGNCRHRKIKCERTFPCQQCRIRGMASSCGSHTLSKELSFAEERRKRIVVQRTDQNQLVPPILTQSPVTYSGSSQDYSPVNVNIESFNKLIDHFKTRIDSAQERINLTSPPSTSQSAMIPPLPSQIAAPSIHFEDECKTCTDLGVILQRMQQLEQKMDLIMKKVSDLAIPEAVEPMGASASTSAADITIKNAPVSTLVDPLSASTATVQPNLTRHNRRRLRDFAPVRQSRRLSMRRLDRGCKGIPSR